MFQLFRSRDGYRGFEVLRQNQDPTRRDNHHGHGNQIRQVLPVHSHNGFEGWLCIRFQLVEQLEAFLKFDTKLYKLCEMKNTLFVGNLLESAAGDNRVVMDSPLREPTFPLSPGLSSRSAP